MGEKNYPMPRPPGKKLGIVALASDGHTHRQLPSETETPENAGRAGEHRTRARPELLTSAPKKGREGTWVIRRGLVLGEGRSILLTQLLTWGVVPNPAWASDMLWENYACITCDSTECWALNWKGDTRL